MYPVYRIIEEKGANFGRGTTSTNERGLKKENKILNDLMFLIERLKG